MNSLPSNWAHPEFPEVIQLNPPKPSTEFATIDTEVTFIPMPSVNGETGKIEAPQVRKISEVNKGYTSFKEGDVLFAKITPCMENGKSAIVDKTLNGIGFGSTEFHILRNSSGVLPQYVHYFIRQRDFLKRAESNMRGAVGQKRVPTEYLRDHKIPLPPLAEQHRIVAKIEELFSDLDAGIASLKKAKEQLKTYRMSSLWQLLEGENTGSDSHQEGWGKTNLGEILESLRNGLPEKPNGESGTRIFRISALRPNKIDVDDVRYYSVPPRNYRDYFLEMGDLLFTRYNGNPHLVGVCAVVPNLAEPTLHPDKLIRGRVKPGINPKFVAYSANFGITRRHLEERTRTTAGQAGISGSDIKSAPIHIPTITIQDKIVSEIESRLSEADNLDKTLDAALAQSESLRQSILKQAFEGKLVPQDPNDEPAEKLLERIRAERAANEEAPKKRGRYGGGSRSETRSVAEGPGTPVEGGAPKPRRGRPPGKKATAAKRRG